ncbi:MAG: D-Ala-D-Ala carboxypeptidase family metallohydrolase [Roseicyclus sp.]
MPKKITIDQLMAKLADLETDKADLSDYFIVDEDASRPFAPQFRLNPQTVAIPRGPEAGARTALAMNGANWFARMHRQGAFYKRLRAGYSGPVIVSEGDSWFQYPILLKDTIDHLMEDYAIFSLGAAGDLLQRMADKAEFIGALRDKNAGILLLSGGGNDLVAGGALALHLEEFDPSFAPEDYLLPSFQALLDNAIVQYTRMFETVRQQMPHVKIICHGYDYPVPAGDRWLGKPMESRGIRDRGLQKAIARVMMDMFNRRLRRAARATPHVTYIDCRGVVGDHRWHDGLHPTDEGYGAVADLFRREIGRIANARSAPPILRGGPFGTKEELLGAMSGSDTAAETAPPSGRGISLHVGVDKVDPAHYAGWDGALRSCEKDARAMERLARARGFETRILLTSAATRAAVVAGIREAAAELRAGDMFLFSVSGHGGRIPDFNRDEDHDGDEKMDETLCLHDFQLADDELYMLWGEFRAGVRVLMVTDTCHSGSMVRAGPALPTTLFGQTIASPREDHVRMMPLDVEEKVWRQNRDAYRDASRSYSAIRESVMMSPLTSPVKASVLNLGACKDTQYAIDGPENGAFTGALLEIWNDGRFAGDYRAFRAAIEARIGSDSQTPQLFDALHKAPHFIGDVPFSIGASAPARDVSPAYAAAVAAPGGEADEGLETDTLPDEDVRAIFEAKRDHVRMRSGDAPLNWADYAEFDRFVASLGLEHFGTVEFLVLGGAHATAGGSCAGLNAYPPKALWPNVARTARVLDALRKRLGRPIAITNAYRAPAYNACLGGAASSLHMTFNALDFKVSGMAAPDVAMALRWLRDKEGLFHGGIGRYDGFTHVDTRGTNATWSADFRDARVPDAFPMPSVA